VNCTAAPTRSCDRSSDGTAASSRIEDGSMTVKSSVPELTTSPTLTSRIETIPLMGARMTASPS